MLVPIISEALCPPLPPCTQTALSRGHLPSPNLPHKMFPPVWSVSPSVTLSGFHRVCVFLDRYRALVDHGTSYIFWKLWTKAYRLYFLKVYYMRSGSSLRIFYCFPRLLLCKDFHHLYLLQKAAAPSLLLSPTFLRLTPASTTPVPGGPSYDKVVFLLRWSFF